MPCLVCLPHCWCNYRLRLLQQQRRVQQEVDRDLAPLRRLGALAAAGRGLSGYSDVARGGMSEARSRAAGEGNRMRRGYAGARALPGAEESGICGGHAEVEDSRLLTKPWSEEAVVERGSAGYRWVEHTPLSGLSYCMLWPAPLHRGVNFAVGRRATKAISPPVGTCCVGMGGGRL